MGSRREGLIDYKRIGDGIDNRDHERRVGGVAAGGLHTAHVVYIGGGVYAWCTHMDARIWLSPADTADAPADIGTATSDG